MNQRSNILPLAGLAALLLCTAAPAFAQQAPAARAQSCAADYHARLSEIASRELVAYREAGTAIGAVDAALPGRPIFAAPRRPDIGPESRRAVEAATRLARAQGRTSFARDANTRWIAERIREDLTDYLRQKPSPFLCAGLQPYLARLKDYAAQGAPAPERLREDFAAQRTLASASLDAAFRAMRTPPLPRFAPADRPTGPAEGLRLALDASFREAKDEPAPTRFADRGVRSQISASRTDPDLPPLLPQAQRPLDDEADTMRALTALFGTAVRGGFLAEAPPMTGAEPAGRPVLARLAAISAHLDRPEGRIADPIVRPAIEQALFDLEMLDYLRVADGGSGDPLTSAMYGTMAAIETAHAESCACAN